MNANEPNMSGGEGQAPPVPPEPPVAGASPPLPPEPPPEPGPEPPAAPVGPAPLASELQNKKLISGLLAILLGGLGVHKFYLGYQQEGIIMLLVTVVGGGIGGSISCGLLAPVLIVMPVIGLIEGILYLTKSDAEFEATYLRGRKPWF